MTTLKLPEPLTDERSPKRVRPYQARLRPYLFVPRYQRGGTLELRVKDPPPVMRVTLTMEKLLVARRRHNSLDPRLEPTHRILLRWNESGGTGMPNPEADVRETHYDPLPPDQHRRVDAIVDSSPWAAFTRKFYRTTLTNKQLATELGIGKSQLYVDWNAALWYFRGRFESEGIHG